MSGGMNGLMVDLNRWIKLTPIKNEIEIKSREKRNHEERSSKVAKQTGFIYMMDG